MVDELGLVEKIDAMIPQDLEQRNISVGMAVKAMILIGLGFVQRALYLTPDFFRGKPVGRLLGPGITAEMLNDDLWVACASHCHPTRSAYDGLAPDTIADEYYECSIIGLSEWPVSLG